MKYSQRALVCVTIKRRRRKKHIELNATQANFITSNKGLRSFHQNTGKKWRKKKQRRKMVSICELRMQMKHELKINTSNLLALFYIHQQKNGNFFPAVGEQMSWHRFHNMNSCKTTCFMAIRRKMPYSFPPLRLHSLFSEMQLKL